MTEKEQPITIERPDFLGGGSWVINGLNAITVVLGRNGSGKSQLLRSLRDTAAISSHYVVPERTGEITFEAGLMIEVGNAQSRRNRSNGNFSSNYRQEVVTRIQAYYTKRGTKRVDAIKHDPEDLLQALSIVLPDFKVSVKDESPFYELLRVKDGSSVTSVSALSSGESQLLSLGMDILTIVGIWELDQTERRVLLVDEPDAHIHPDLQIKFADFLCHVHRKYEVQILVATHSTTLLSALGQFANEQLSVLYLTEQLSLTAQPFNAVTRELSALLGGHLLMGPLFAAPVLLVEGDDDYRVWLQVARSGSIRLCVMPCNGDEIKQYQRTLERMFSALSENADLRGIALIDGDKPLPTPQPNSPQHYVRFARLECHETENLYITDEVLKELGHESWDVAKSKIAAAADRFGNKADPLRALASIDRKQGDIKPVISEIAEILDPKKLLWSVRLGKFIGRETPTGQLAEFIGKKTMELLWPEVAAAAANAATAAARARSD